MIGALALLLAACDVEQPTPDAAPPAPDAGSGAAVVAEDARPAVALCGAPGWVTGAGVGGLRLGTSAAEARTACADVRDTTFVLAEGLAERALAVPFPGGVALALVPDDTVRRIVVTGPGVRTRAGVATSTAVGALRAAYPVTCADRGEGAVVLFAPALDGVTFVTSARTLPPADEDRVLSLLVHGNPVRCP